jgi:ABC transporter substrate binding protein
MLRGPITRRYFVSCLGGAAAALPLAAHAQEPKMLRVGFVGMQPREFPLYAAFLKRMAELGYQEGRNFTFDYIQTPNIEGYEKNYRELAARKVDVFLAVGNEPALRAALSAADGRPIAFLVVDFDPLAKGYVASLSHPGGNVTGIFVRQLELAAKRVEIAREAFPRASNLPDATTVMRFRDLMRSPAVQSALKRSSDTFSAFALRAMERVLADQSRTDREIIALGLPQNSRIAFGPYPKRR